MRILLSKLYLPYSYLIISVIRLFSYRNTSIELLRSFPCAAAEISGRLSGSGIVIKYLCCARLAAARGSFID